MLISFLLLIIAASFDVVYAKIEVDSLSKQAEKLLEDDKPDEAINLCNQILKENPDNSMALAFRGWAYIKTDKYDLAFEDCNKALQIDPRNKVAFNYRGACYESKGETTKALIDYAKAMKIDPKWFKPYYYRGSLYYDQENYEKALADFNTAIKCDPKFAPSYSMRGMTYMGMDNPEEAFKDLDKSIELDPEDPWNYAARGLANLYIIRLNDAARDLEKSIELDPQTGSYEPYIMLAAIQFITGSFAKSKENFHKVLEFEKEDQFIREISNIAVVITTIAEIRIFIILAAIAILHAIYYLSRLEPESEKFSHSCNPGGLGGGSNQ